jgi:hypothetical protein
MDVLGILKIKTKNPPGGRDNIGLSAGFKYRTMAKNLLIKNETDIHFSNTAAAVDEVRYLALKCPWLEYEELIKTIAILYGDSFNL